jgi:hypothetical protein
MSKPEMLLWLSDARGVYIPRDFANSFANRAVSVSGVSDEDWTTLESGPDAEWYWESWETVLNNATVIDDEGVKFSVYQDGDCWLIPHGMEWSSLENSQGADGYRAVVDACEAHADHDKSVKEVVKSSQQAFGTGQMFEKLDIVFRNATTPQE